MQKKWKKTGAALLAVTLTVSGASYAWAADGFDTVSITKVTENKSTDTVKVDKDFSPSNTSKKLIGLLHAYEQAGDAEAKAAIKKAIDRQISEYEAYVKNNDSKAETVVFLSNIIALVKAYESAPTEEAKASIKQSIKQTIADFKKTMKLKADTPVKKEPIVKPVEPVETKPEKKEPKKHESKHPHKAVKHEKKEEKKALKEQQKLERKALKATEKAEKKALKAAEKAERKANREKHSHEHKKGKKHEDHPNHNKR